MKKLLFFVMVVTALCFALTVCASAAQATVDGAVYNLNEIGFDLKIKLNSILFFCQMLEFCIRICYNGANEKRESVGLRCNQ